MDEIDYLAQLQGAYVARSIASTAGTQSESLQRYVETIGRVHHRDLFIVNTERRIVADVDTDEIGKIFDLDGADLIAQTLRDGVPRTFVERDNGARKGMMHQVVVPMRAGLKADDAVVGALVLQYSEIREELLDVTLRRICLVVGVALASALVIGLLGLRLGNSVARRLGRLQAGVHEMAAGRYEARVAMEV